MGRVIRNDIASLSSVSSKLTESNYNEYQKTLIDAKHEADFLFATDVIEVKKEFPFTSGIYINTLARAQRITIPDKAEYLGDDFRKLLFKSLEEVVEVGYKFKIDNEDWLCYNTDNIGAITKSAYVRRCNATLKWKNKYGAIVSEPAFVGYFKFAQTTNTIEFDKQMRLGGNLRLAVLQANEKTDDIVKDMRFIFDNLAFRVTNVTRLTHKGLVEVSLEEHLINKITDSATLEVADYNAPTKFDIIVESGHDSIYIGEVDTVSYKVLYDGVEVSEDCIIESSDDLIVSVNNNIITGVSVGSAIVTVYLVNNENIKTQINVSVKEVVADAFISGQDIVRFGGSYQYFIENNTDSDYEFSISSSDVYIEKVDELSCVIKAPNKVINFVITATGDTEILTKNISVRSMWL